MTVNAVPVTAVALLVGVALTGAWWLSRRYGIVVVHGHSMLPTLAAGDRLLIRRSPSATIRSGQIAVFRSSSPVRQGAAWAVKRVAAVSGEPVPAELACCVTSERIPRGRLAALGDNRRLSYDSRHHGLIDESQLMGVVIRRLRHTPSNPRAIED